MQRELSTARGTVRTSARRLRSATVSIPATFNEAIADRWLMVDEKRTGRRSGTVILQKGNRRLSVDYTPSAGHVGYDFARPKLTK